MKRGHILILSLLPVTGMLFWWGWSVADTGRAPNGTSRVESTRALERRPDVQSQTPERVRTAAQRKIPDVHLEQNDGIAFAEIDPRIDELDVMEILLEIESKELGKETAPC
ncbi:hypothetical protein ACFQY0_18605 [Haloferula chungangensis]|uniref:Uncharacterized protein n=1 Tax=Haloferula chungangensis TaxID=1048331 RepID=A0ABW2LE18_9BACT